MAIATDARRVHEPPFVSCGTADDRTADAGRRLRNAAADRLGDRRSVPSRLRLHFICEQMENEIKTLGRFLLANYLHRKGKCGTIGVRYRGVPCSGD